MSYSIEQKVSGNIHPAIKYMMDSDCIVVFYRCHFLKTVDFFLF